MSSKNKLTHLNNKSSWREQSSRQLKNWASRTQGFIQAQDQLGDPFYQEANIEVADQLEQRLND